MIDCFKKVRESSGNIKRAMVMEELAPEAGTIMEEEDEGTNPLLRTRPTTQGAKDMHGRAVVLNILNPVN